jgi:hypothetical protein
VEFFDVQHRSLNHDVIWFKSKGHHMPVITSLRVHYAISANITAQTLDHFDRSVTVELRMWH